MPYIYIYKEGTQIHEAWHTLYIYICHDMAYDNTMNITNYVVVCRLYTRPGECRCPNIQYNAIIYKLHNL